MTYFDDNFPGVRAMLEKERDEKNAAGAANPNPWKVMGLNLGLPQVESSHRTEKEARAELARIRRRCAPHIRNCFWVEAN